MFTLGPPIWIEFEGTRYYRNRKGGGHYLSAKSKPLHRAVFEGRVGPIPPGHVIHHKDGRPWNNDPENLEPLTRGDHVRRHQDEDPTLYVSGDRGRTGAAVMWAERKPVARVCQCCTEPYESRSTYSRFCSKLCAGRAARNPDLRGGGIAAADR